MEKTIANFNREWPFHIDMVLSNKEIQEYLDLAPTVEIAVDRASDYVVSQGIGDVQE